MAADFINILMRRVILTSQVFFFTILLINGQVILSDSLALVSLYETTNGENWNDNTNWLAGPVFTWSGVALTPDGQRVAGIILPANNLQGDIPPPMQTLDSLQVFQIAQNHVLTVPDLSHLQKLQLLDISQNNLGFGSIEPYFLPGPPPPLFNYFSQDSAGTEVDTCLVTGSHFELVAEVDGIANLYFWFKDGVFLTITTGNTLFLDSIVCADEGTYYCQVINEIVPDLEIFTELFFIKVAEMDSTGALIKKRQLIVQYTPDVTQEDKDTIRNEFMVNVLDSVLCRDIELWGLPDTVFFANGDSVLSIEEIRTRAKAKAKVEEVDFNHIVGTDGLASDRQCVIPRLTIPPAAQNDSSVIITILDTGVDFGHPELDTLSWVNTAELPNGVDDDGNCIPDDLMGFNFIDKSPDISDNQGHGTHLAGIARNRLDAGANAVLMSVKTHDEKGRGDVFAMISGIYYAGSKDARVINISSGYQGVASAIMENAIQEVGDSNAVIVVCSAGNTASNNDLEAHYPSSFDLPNIISVAALNAAEDSLAIFFQLDTIVFGSSYGVTSVDIAAPGTDINSTAIGGMFVEKSGTSMAAAYVSGVVANLVSANPGLSSTDIIDCIYASADSLPALDGKIKTGKKINPDQALSCVTGVAARFTLKAFLEGPFDPGTQLMRAVLDSLGYLPHSEPYSGLGFPMTAGQSDTISNAALALTGAKKIVDWGLLELRDKSDSSMILFGRPVLFTRDGTVLLPDGDTTVTFPFLPQDNYFIALRHRTHLGQMTAAPVSISTTPVAINFSDGSQPPYFPAANVLLAPGIFGSRSGDTDLNGVIDATDRAEAWNQRNTTGYSLFDVNLDGAADSGDRSLIWNNRNALAQLPQ